MKRSLLSFFSVAHILVGIISMIFVALFGSYTIERHLEESTEETLLYIAECISNSTPLPEYLSSEDFQHMKRALESISVLQKTTICVIEPDGNVLLSTEDAFPEKLKSFRLKDWDLDSAYVGTFFGAFKTPRLSVMTPVYNTEQSLMGYVSVHYRMDKLYTTRSNLMGIILLIFFSMYLLSYVLLFLYRQFVHKPMQTIISGASEFANGNLEHVIPVQSENELGYLAQSLNYMAEKLNQNGSYQRQFIANISHDFRSPLTSIKGYVEAMLDGVIPPDMHEKYLKIISSETNRLEKLTRSLLTLNDLDVSKRMISTQIFDICLILRSTTETFEGICKNRNITLELNVPSQPLIVCADLERIQQVIYNLLDNAIKFSPDNSTILLEATEKKGKVFVSIQDYGCGIPKEDLPKIWDRFFKSDSSRGRDRKGTGLGLSIVREIINAHGENINVISTEGVGTEFIFTLEKAKNNLTSGMGIETL